MLVSLPTGTGKPLCYGLLPFMPNFLQLSVEAPPHQNIVKVVSPLNSLMYNQEAKFSSRGLKCTALRREDHAVVQDIRHGEYLMVFLSLE